VPVQAAFAAKTFCASVVAAWVPSALKHCPYELHVGTPTQEPVVHVPEFVSQAALSVLPCPLHEPLTHLQPRGVVAVPAKVVPQAVSEVKAEQAFFVRVV